MNEDLAVLKAVDEELSNMVDAFGNLLRASRVDEEAEVLAKDRAPGDLLEVWAEKLVGSSHAALQLISQLKRGALLSDFESLIKSVRTMRTAFSQEEEHVGLRLGAVRQDVQALLAQLEASYHGSTHKGQLPAASTQPGGELGALAALAAEVKRAQ